MYVDSRCAAEQSCIALHTAKGTSLQNYCLEANVHINLLPFKWRSSLQPVVYRARDSGQEPLRGSHAQLSQSKAGIFLQLLLGKGASSMTYLPSAEEEAGFSDL